MMLSAYDVVIENCVLLLIVYFYLLPSPLPSNRSAPFSLLSELVTYFMYFMSGDKMHRKKCFRDP